MIAHWSEEKKVGEGFRSGSTTTSLYHFTIAFSATPSYRIASSRLRIHDKSVEVEY